MSSATPMPASVVHPPAATIEEDFDEDDDDDDDPEIAALLRAGPTMKRQSSAAASPITGRNMPSSETTKKTQSPTCTTTTTKSLDEQAATVVQSLALSQVNSCRSAADLKWLMYKKTPIPVRSNLRLEDVTFLDIDPVPIRQGKKVLIEYLGHVHRDAGKFDSVFPRRLQAFDWETMNAKLQSYLQSLSRKASFRNTDSLARDLKYEEYALKAMFEKVQRKEQEDAIQEKDKLGQQAGTCSSPSMPSWSETMAAKTHARAISQEESEDNHAEAEADEEEEVIPVTPGTHRKKEKRLRPGDIIQYRNVREGQVDEIITTMITGVRPFEDIPLVLQNCGILHKTDLIQRTHRRFKSHLEIVKNPTFIAIQNFPLRTEGDQNLRNAFAQQTGVREVYATIQQELREAIANGMMDMAPDTQQPEKQPSFEKKGEEQSSPEEKKEEQSSFETKEEEQASLLIPASTTSEVDQWKVRLERLLHQEQAKVEEHAQQTSSRRAYKPHVSLEQLEVGIQVLQTLSSMSNDVSMDDFLEEVSEESSASPYSLEHFLRGDVDRKLSRRKIEANQQVFQKWLDQQAENSRSLRDRLLGSTKLQVSHRKRRRRATMGTPSRLSRRRLSLEQPSSGRKLPVPDPASLRTHKRPRDAGPTSETAEPSLKRQRRQPSEAQQHIEE